MSVTFPGLPQDVAEAHENTYARHDVSGTVHRNRLKGVIKAISKLPLPATGRFADFSPSNGHLLRAIQEGAFADKDWAYDGFELDPEVTALWQHAGLPKTTFHTYDLMHPTPVEQQYDLVVSIGMFEHIVSWKPGLPILLDACKPGGHLVVGLPNEGGFAGMVKFLGRDVLRRNAYDDFFAGSSKFAYFMALITGARLDTFRKPQAWYETHIGFDIRPFRDDLIAMCAAPRWTLLSHTRTPGGANWLWVFRKNA